PIPVPSVVGEPLDQAISNLQNAGFNVGTPRYTDSNEPKDTVIGQDPFGNTSAPRGTTVTLTVSKGPTTVTVPDVTGPDVTTATSLLTQAGFKVAVRKIQTTAPALNDQVLSQDPNGGTEAPPKSTVTITVGKYTAPPSTTTTTTGTTSTVAQTP